MKSLRLVIPYFRDRWIEVALGVLFLIIVDFLQLFIPRIIKWVVDELTAFQIDLPRLWMYALYMLGIGLLIGVFRFGWRHFLIGLSRNVEEGIRNRLFSHIQTLSASYFDKTKTGDLMAHATNDIQHIRMAMGMGIVALTDAIVLGASAIGFMLYINVKLTLYALIPMPLIVLGARFFSKKMHRYYGEVQGEFSELTEAVRERFAGIRIIKAYTRKATELSFFAGKSKAYVQSNMRLVRITGSFFPMMIFFTNLSLAIIIYFGGQQAVRATITPGDFAAFIIYLRLIAWPMMALGWVTNLIQRGRASLDRVNTIIETEPEIIEPASPATPLETFKRITFEDISFSYNGNLRSVLNNIRIEIQAGEILGIIGPPGSGKTTLLNLLPRLYDVSGGRILIDAVDIRKMRISDLRRLISNVPQEPFLFAGTIRDNITLADPLIQEEALMEAVEKAALYETIHSFPDGFDTLVGERGIILSGGQKQRIALARAFLNDAPILILDDPISQVDVETGAGIIRSISQMAGHRTIFIVSHRLSAVRFADRIISMVDGRIVGSGSHSELLETNRYYSKTYHLQELEEELDLHAY
ncbi:MAG TPA: ABC transporter ATP-binding protein [Deltaproteobacteria bacterium]|nr:ABC transporter ATP-binding protein [Deltaproteobacteria bacterium]